MSSAPSPEPHRRNTGQGAPRPSEQTASVPDPRKEVPPQGYRAERGATPPPLNILSPVRNIDVRRRYSDPFTIGIVVGAIAATIGFLLGMLYVLLN